MNSKVRTPHRPSLIQASRLPPAGQPRYGHGYSASKELKDVLERKIEELSRQLTDERQLVRQTKISLTRSQKELARVRAHNKPKEHLSKELEHEKMLRVEAERRLHDMTRESENCRARLENLQHEFNKMEHLVSEMMQYKSKIDQLKQENSSLAVTYENSIEKSKHKITDLERENMMLLNEVKKLESQINHKTDGRDRSKLLLERLRMLEGENSSLVLENEQQRGQYEKCLDEIANQVVQALLAQKMLREECMKLQNRVHDLELHNHHLVITFQQRMKMAADAIQNGNGSNIHQELLTGSIESLHSMFSEQTTENLPSIAQMSSPPPWLQERLPGDRHSLASIAGSMVSAPDLDFAGASASFNCRTEIETEFPATPSSPKSKHVNVIERKCDKKRSASVSSLTSNRGPTKQRTLSTSSLSRARGLSLVSQPKMSLSHESGIQIATTTSEPDSPAHIQGKSASFKSGAVNKDPRINSSTNHNSVPFNQSNSSTSNQSNSQGQNGNVNNANVSKIPTGMCGSVKSGEEQKLRRNSLKAEFSIKMGVQNSTVRSATPKPSNLKPPQAPSPSPSSRSSSVTSDIGQGPSRSPSATSSRSTTPGSRIPTSARSGPTSTAAKQEKSSAKSTNQTATAAKSKTTNQVKCTTSRLIPPKSPQLRYSGIRTTLKNENQVRAVTKSEASSQMTMSSVSSHMRSVYSISPAHGRSQSMPNDNGDHSRLEGAKPPVPSRSEKGSYRTEMHYPIMGLTKLNHTSPKAEEASKLYANIVTTPSQFLSTPASSSHANDVDSVDGVSTMVKGQYFYDYSDEDSDFNRPVSKDFSIASTVSLDELLDNTLETSVDFDFTSDHFLFNAPNMLGAKTINNNNKSKTSPESVSSDFYDNQQTPKVEAVECCMRDSNSNKVIPTESAEVRLRGKPDIVKDTEECEQRNLQKSLTVSQIPGSSLPGYRAKRPKSLILGAKEKKFLYCEYGSSSSSENSDDDWSYQFSYAKNVKQQEIQSKVAKSLKTGKAKVIETTKSDTSISDKKSDKTKSDPKQSQDLNKCPKASLTIKPSKIPPPVAVKPVRTKPTSPSCPETVIPVTRPKSVEICVNTALSVASSRPCFTYINKDTSKSESEKCLVSKGNPSSKTEEMTTTFEEVKVERSGSKDDGYSTMSSDVQPELMEKYSDGIESSSNSNEIRTSNLSLSSQNSFSSDDRHSGHGSLSRVKAMKMKYEMEAQKAQEEKISPKSPPPTPIKTYLKSPKHFREKTKEPAVENKSTPVSKLVKPKLVQQPTTTTKVKSNLPILKSIIKKDTVIVKQTSSEQIMANPSEKTNVSPVKNIDTPVPATPVKCNDINLSESCLKTPTSQYNLPQTSTPKNIMEQFSQLTYFAAPTFDHLQLFQDGFDSNSSLSDRGSDLTSLHISEDNILSDIPEEKDGYESSVGQRSENTSLVSLPTTNSAKKSPEKPTPAHSSHSHTHKNSSFQQLHKIHFTTTLKKFWSSQYGLVRARCNADYDKQKRLKETADYEELYGGCLNIESLLERSCSESDLYTRGDKPDVVLLPRLPKSQSAECLIIDEILVEERVQVILKQNVMQQISQTVESADRDEEHFSSFVELLIQRGHVMESESALSNKRSQRTMETPTPVLNKMTVSTFSSLGKSPNDSSMGQNSCKNLFETEEKKERDNADEDFEVTEQKKFNSRFYSLCNTGSSKSLSENSEARCSVANDSQHNKSKTIHTCKEGDDDCRKCLDEKNQIEFDDISRQIETLSRTVNQLHQSLSSLNSDDNDSGPESNEGDSRMVSAIGNKDLDGYHWVEDEFFLSPYSGEIILGDSPFSNTGASCDWMNNYSEPASRFDEPGGKEALHEELVHELPIEFRCPVARQMKIKPPRNSILAASIDREGNFDSQHFISQRLKLEEERRLSGCVNDNCDVMNIGENVGVSLRSQLQGTKLLKEDLRITPEKDVDDTELEQFKSLLGDSLQQYGGSQDSLDDNIGVDNVMCHRLIGQGQPLSTQQIYGARPPLTFDHSQFIRYGDLEKQAVAAFDFLHEMTASVSSDQSSEKKKSHDLFLRNPMNISTTSNESRASPVKRNRRKLRSRVKVDINKQQSTRSRKFSSTSADSNNDDSDDDVSFSDSFCDSYSSDNEEVNTGNNIHVQGKAMTYL